MRMCAFGRVLEDDEKCVFEKATTDVCVCSRPLWRSSLSNTNQTQLKENLVDSQSDSATNSKEREEVKSLKDI